MHGKLNVRLFQAFSFLQIESTVSGQDWFQATMLYFLETYSMHFTFCILEIKALAPGTCSVTVPETKCLKPGPGLAQTEPNLCLSKYPSNLIPVILHAYTTYEDGTAERSEMS